MEWKERKENSKGFVFKGLGSDLLGNPGRWPQLSQPRAGKAGVFICHLQSVWVRAAQRTRTSVPWLFQSMQAKAQRESSELAEAHSWKLICGLRNDC